MVHSNIIVKGAKTNNLKNVDVNIPVNKITVLTGVSGSGKSSLAFETLAAESQREINKNYSAYIQQLLPKYAKPDIDTIQNLPFSVVVNQKGISGNARSTVGTFTEIYTALRLLFPEKHDHLLVTQWLIHLTIRPVCVQNVKDWGIFKK